MARKAIYTEEEKQARHREAMKRYHERKGSANIQKVFSITLPPQEHADHLQTLTAHGFKNAPDFWRFCIELLKADKLPQRGQDPTPTESAAADAQTPKD